MLKLENSWLGLKPSSKSKIVKRVSLMPNKELLDYCTDELSDRSPSAQWARMIAELELRTRLKEIKFLC